MSSTASLMPSIRRRLTISVKSILRIARDNSIFARPTRHLARRHFRLSAFVTSTYFSASLCRFSCASLTRSICFRTSRWRAGRQVEVAFFAALALQLVVAVRLLRIHDFDAGRSERAEQIVQVFARTDVRRQQFVDFIVDKETLFLADHDQLADLVVFLFNR